MGIAEVIEFLKKNPNKEFTTTDISKNINSSRTRILNAVIRIKKHLNLYPNLTCRYIYVKVRRKTSNGFKWCIEKRYLYSWIKDKERKTKGL